MNKQYQSNTDESKTVEQYYQNELRDWFGGIAFRMLVYVGLLAFTASQMVVFSKLYDAGVMTEGRESVAFAFGLLGLVVGAMTIGDFARGASYAAIAFLGKHRGFVALGVGLTVYLGLQWSNPGNISGDHAEAYGNVAWAMAVLVGLEVVRGGIYSKDIKQVRSRVRGVLG